MAEGVIRENLPGCIGTRRPIPPNDCRTCRHHADFTCDDIRVVVHGDSRVRPVPKR